MKGLPPPVSNLPLKNRTLRLSPAANTKGPQELAFVHMGSCVAPSVNKISPIVPPVTVAAKEMNAAVEVVGVVTARPWHEAR